MPRVRTGKRGRKKGMQVFKMSNRCLGANSYNIKCSLYVPVGPLEQQEHGNIEYLLLLAHPVLHSSSSREDGTAETRPIATLCSPFSLGAAHICGWSNFHASRGDYQLRKADFPRCLEIHHRKNCAGRACGQQHIPGYLHHTLRQLHQRSQFRPSHISFRHIRPNQQH